MTVRGSLVAGLALALLAARAEAQDTPGVVSTGAGASSQALRAGGLVGFEFASGDTGLGLRLDGELPIQTLGPKVDLSVVGSLGYTYFSDTTHTSVGKYSLSTNLFKLVPAARFTIPIAPPIGVYGDVGLGLYWAHSSVDTPFGGDSSDGVGVTMRFAAGGFYDVNEKVRVGAELGWNPYFGDYSDDTMSLLGSVMFRL